MFDRPRRWIFALLALVLLVVSPSVRADNAAALELLKRPGVHAIMRHALAPGFSDPAAFKLNECNTQRNLDEAGRAQARAIGQAMKSAGVAFDQVVTSQWCRCRETAELLALGKPKDLPSLNSFFEDRSTAGQQTEDTKRFLSQLPRNETVMLVTHQVNISALTGRGVASGEVLVIKMASDGTVDMLGSFLLDP